MNSALKPNNEILPVHVAIIMDGNGRWARERKKTRLFGHKAGVKSVRTVVESAREIGIKHLTLYAFSTENWSRPSLEVKGLMNLLDSYLQLEQQNMLKNDIRLRCIGQQDRLPSEVRSTMDKVIQATAGCSTMTLNLALSYGSRSEILRAVRKITEKCADGRLKIEDLDEQMLSEHLDTAGQPDPDLLIRTGGEKRLSNFLLWQASYAELYFTDIKWPDFGRREFVEAITDFGARQRRFGKTGSQLFQE
ncbi:MAG: isoprenyl transferase [Desulfobulbaceae bacterium]|nr:isoprenyl transferase [Desulfobulbaceae bacterium]